MNNESLNQFAKSATFLDMQRSKFKRPFRVNTSLMSGRLYPLYWDEILPGDTVSMDLGSLVRMSTPLYPVMDNCFLDVHAYFVPNRLLWEHWEEFCGANKSTYWTQPITFVPPTIKIQNNAGFPLEKTIMDYLGLPVDYTYMGTGQSIEVSALPIRAYCQIWNEWFRDENVMQPVNVDLTSGSLYYAGQQNSETYEQYISTGHYVTNAQKGDMPLPVAKFHDYFTSCLPSPQKGTPVSLALAGDLPVKNAKLADVTAGKTIPFNPYWYKNSGGNYSPFESGYGNHNIITQGQGSGNVTSTAIDTVTVPGGSSTGGYLSLVADLSKASLVTINAIREAFAVQRFLERQARGGTRYTEILQSFYGVTSSDASLQRPQLLGGRRIPINMTQVAQTSASDPNDVASPQGNLAAYSQTIDGDHLFTASFEEHGILMVVACIRTARSYQQGIEKKWTRKTLTDMYWPTFANLGEQPVYRRELFMDNSPDTVFGYQEAWAEYRYCPNKITGEMRSTGSAGYDSWHYADYYTSAPTLTMSWLIEDSKNIERTLAVQGVDQFIAQFAFDDVWVRPMPVYSIPGLIDHH